MALTTIGSIAGHIARSFIFPAGISGNLIEIVDTARIDVQNFTGNMISPESIDEKYQSAITNFAKAQALDECFAWAAAAGVSGTSAVAAGNSLGQNVKLGELEISESNKNQQAEALSAIAELSKNTPNQLREMAIQSIKNIGRSISFVRSLS